MTDEYSGERLYASSASRDPQMHQHARFAYVVFVLMPSLLMAQSAARKAPAGEPGTQQNTDTSSETVLFNDPPVVETAALYAQTLQEAPANVTIITQQQIRTYGYRTLAEALSNVRGFYITADGGFHFAGVRGFALPGDYNTRILVMVNGHYLTDNVYSAMYLFGQDFGIDMDLVDRIEIVRGPSSAIYGSNGMFATINIFTRAPADAPRGLISTELGSFGEKKTLVSAAAYLGRGANLLIATSAFHTSGRTVQTPGLGEAASVGAEQGYHTFAQLTWHHWSLTANFNDRRAFVPIGFYGADFGSTGTRSNDSHNFAEAALTRPVGNAAELRWRLYYDQFRYYGRYDYTDESVTWDNRDYALGDWLGSQVAYRRTAGRLAGLTVGSQVNADIRNTQVTEDVAPEYGRVRDTRKRNESWGVFTQYERSLGRNWVLFGGVRLDDSRLDKAFVSPKLAAIWKTSQQTSWKFIYGRAFRNPSTFERFWEPSPLLGAEKMHTFEVTREQRLGGRVDLIAGAFHYRIDRLIEGVDIGDNKLQYRNAATSRATGIELEVNGRPAGWLEMSGSISAQHAGYEHPHQDLPNSPVTVAQFRAGAPLFRNRLTVSTAARYMSSRLTGYGYRVEPVTIADLTATTRRLHRNFDVQCGIRNLMNRRYADPLSTEHLIQVLPRAGRTVFLKLIWQYGE